jgi:hypothetical protein
MKVARYIQIENKIRAIIWYELAAQIPLVPSQAAWIDLCGVECTGLGWF